MTKSYVVDPETGKLLTVQEWMKKTDEKPMRALMAAIVPEDGSHAFAFPLEAFGKMYWHKAMEFAKNYRSPHPVEGSDGTFNLPTRKQGIDFRMAREAGLEQLLEAVGADSLLRELRNNWHWTCEPYVSGGTTAEDFLEKRLSSGYAWIYNIIGLSNNYGFSSYQFTVRPVTLLKL